MKKILLVFMALIGAMAGAPTTPITNGSFTGAGVVQTGASLAPTGTGTIRATSALSPAATNLTLGTASFGTGLTFTSATGAGVFAVSAASPFFASTNADVADAGAIRLGNGELIAWESSPAGTDVTLTVNSSEQFVFSNPLLSPTFITPALGTPASGVATNLTGTAAGLTAGNVTTNANLTGPITSTGNATSVAAQTGTGSVFVMQNTPTLVTPAIGAATGTSLVVTGNVTTGSGSGVAGASWSIQGTAPTPQANSISYYAPTSVPTAYGISFPSAPTTGFVKRTGTASPQAETIVATIPDTNIAPYSPSLEYYTASDRGTNPLSLLYQHDAWMVQHQGTWYLGWNGNATDVEGVNGQKNYIIRSPAWDQFTDRTPVAEFESASYCTNPINTDAISWQPIFWEVNGALRCAWWATRNLTWANFRGFLSTYDDAAAKWTTYKIQLVSGGTVTFSSSLSTVEANDRVTINSVSYVPCPLAKPIRVGTRWLWAMLLSSVADGATGVGTANRCTLMYSDDDQATWSWINTTIPFTPSLNRNNQWENCITSDGTNYYYWFRNYTMYLVCATTASSDLLTSSNHLLNNGDLVEATVVSGSAGLSTGSLYYVVNATTNTFQVSATLGGSPVDITSDGSTQIAPAPGEGYSMATTTDITTWGNAGSPPFNVMPQRMAPEQDGISGQWYMTLGSVPMFSCFWTSQERRSMSLWRSRNGKDWAPISVVFPEWMQAMYCAPYINGGYTYFATTAIGGIKVGRVPLPDSTKYYSGALTGLLAVAHKTPMVRDNQYVLSGFDYLYVPAVFTRSTSLGLSMAALVTTSPKTNLALDLSRTATGEDNLLPSFDGGFEFQITGPTSVSFVGLGPSPVRAGTAFVGYSDDETLAVRRVVRRNIDSRDNWAITTWNAKHMYGASNGGPADGTTEVIEGTTFTARVTPTTIANTGVAATDIFTATAHGMSNGTLTKLTVSSGGAGLTNGGFYWIIGATANTYQLSATSGGAAVNFTTDMTGNTQLATDVLTVTAVSSTNIFNFMTALRNAAAAMFPTVIITSVGQVYETTTSAQQYGFQLFKTTAFGTFTADGTKVKSDGNVFAVPTVRFTLNGSNTATVDPYSFIATNKPGMAITRLGLWNSALSDDDFKALYNNLVATPGVTTPYQYTASTKQWSSANVLMDPLNNNAAVSSVDYNGHYAKFQGPDIFLPGDSAVSLEVPASGDWTLAGELSFSAVPDAQSFDVLSVGDRLARSTLTVTRAGAVYSLYYGATNLGTVVADKWTSFTINYTASTGTVSMTAPFVATLGAGCASKAMAGRVTGTIVQFTTINRPSQYSTKLRNIKVY